MGEDVVRENLTRIEKRITDLEELFYALLVGEGMGSQDTPTVPNMPLFSHSRRISPHGWTPRSSRKGIAPERL